MPVIPGDVLKHIQENNDQHVNQLIKFLSIPSISASSASTGDMRRAAEWLLEEAKKLGFKGAIYETPGHPAVYAELCPHKDAPTLLIYGHYDVQPPEPLDEWHSRPFEPVVQNGAIYARGATDDKGQLFAHLKAIESIISTEGHLPLNVKLVFEGEEEIGSEHFEQFVLEHRDILKADFIVVSDGVKYAKDLPAICYGLRGLVYMQLDITGPQFDVHSGVYGGAVANPAHALTRILRSLRDDRGKVLIPGFYDHARDLEDWERKEMASLPFEEAATKKYLGVSQLVPEDGYTVQESMRARPTLDINGIWGGYQGEGSKTIIPATAGAKVSMRLVPDQDAELIMEQFERHVRSIAPPGVHVHITRHHGAEPLLVSRKSPAMTVAERALEYAYGRKPVLIREGGSIGAVMTMKKHLGTDDILLVGFADPDDGIHSPNEHFSLENFYRGTITCAALIYGLAQVKKPVTSKVVQQVPGTKQL
jgi:acetylornithine deacetylase/succinyl-diaminopimelate desuccinylase-like protein